MSKLQGKKQRVVKVADGRGEERATAKGGAALTEAFACRTRVWSDARRHLPARRDPGQGFTCEAWLCALVHGLLAGGHGFSATEPMRGDEVLLSIIGLENAPSAETVEEVAKYLAEPGVGGHAALSEVLRSQAARLLGLEPLRGLLWHGFVPVWIDGTLIETQGRTKDAVVCVKGSWGQMACAAFVGPYAVACDFSRAVGKDKSEGELVASRRLLPAVASVLSETKLMPKSLVLMDSLYGEDGTLSMLEEGFAQARFIVGANGLARAAGVLSEQPETQWTDTTAETKSRGWEESAVCTAWLECEGWKRKRLLVGRRWKNEGEAIVNYAGVVTNLSENDPRAAAIMAAGKITFEQAVWKLYGHKQGMENQWKDLLRDMGLHAMPCGKAAVNAVFLAAAALALNIKTGCVRLCLGKAAMALWRFRRDVIDLPARAARHAGRILVRLLDARERLCREIDEGFARLAAL